MKLPALAIVIAASASLAGAAQAQFGGNSTSGIGISSDGSNTVREACKTELRGRVEITQDQKRLRANSIDIFSAKRADKKACGSDVDRMEASGDVFYVTPLQKVRGDKAIYVAAAKTITITGNVVVTSEDGVAQTNRLVLNTETNDAQMGDANAATGQRVRAVIYPNQKTAAPKP
ncbi:hypothetical protein BH11PSE2_BH11PSE2_17940 [soil metagenome]